MINSFFIDFSCILVYHIKIKEGGIMSSKKKTKLNELSFVELQTQLEHTFWNIDKETKENKTEKLQKLKFEIIDELQKFYSIEYLYITLITSKNILSFYKEN